MKKPDFANMPLDLTVNSHEKAEWQNNFKTETGKSPEDMIIRALENIDIDPIIFMQYPGQRL